MAVTIFKVFAPNEILFASDLNSSFLQIINGGQDVGDPRTKAANMAGFNLNLDADGNTSIRANTDDQIDVAIGGTDRLRVVAGGVYFNGVLISGALNANRSIDMRTSVIASQLNELEERLAINTEMFSPGGM